MAAKGSIAKGEIQAKILEVFPGSFLYNDGKEIRINTTENGAEIQIKVTLTAAKEAVSNGMDNFSTSSAQEEANTENVSIDFSSSIVEPTKEEKVRLQELLSQLNL